MTAADPARREVTPPSRYLDAWRRWIPKLPAQHVATALGVRAGQSVLVVGAHPDDETFGAGGMIADLVATGIAVHVLTLTRGEAAVDHLGVSFPGLAARRTRELAAACRALGVSGHDQLDLPDGAVDARALLARDAVLAAARRRGTHHLLCVWWDDPHPDHAATGHATLAAAARLGLPVTGFPIWALHWTDPTDLLAKAAKVILVQTTPSALRRRQAAVRCYVSQTRPLSPELQPVLPPSMTQTDEELVIRP